MLRKSVWPRISHTFHIRRGRAEGEGAGGRIGLRDVIYVAPGTFHQFHATGDEPLGFLCIVDRERDRPVLPTDSDLEKLGERDPVRRRIRT